MKKSVAHSLLVVATFAAALVACERPDAPTPAPVSPRPTTRTMRSHHVVTAQWVLHKRPVQPAPGWT
ncbi:MAG TPA: hypothetical protein VF450_13295 [Noviherbaspirillum sp.]|jgi:hypothetical protein